MAEFPALPLWTDAYLGDTTHLTTFEHGAYLLLLIVAWRAPGGRLPDDDAMLARYTRMTRDKWRKTRVVLAPFFDIRDGHWHQRRLQDELQHLQSRRAQQSEAGKASAAAKSLKRGNRGSTPVARPLQRNGNGEATPISSSTLPNGKGAEAPSGDPRKVMFDAGVALLTATGSSERNARGLIAKWQRAHGDGWTVQAIAGAAGKTDPISWIEQQARRKKPDADEAAEIRRATIDRYRRMDMPGPPARMALEGTEH